MIAVTFFPPAPTAVSMLKVVETFQTLLRNRFKLFEITTPVGMSGCGARLFDAAEDLMHRSLRLETEIAQRFRSGDCGQKTAHRLFGAAVWIIDQIWQRIEHRGRHARRNLNGESG